MRTSLYAAIAALILFTLLGSVYVVREDQTALVLNLGRVVRSAISPRHACKPRSRPIAPA